MHKKHGYEYLYTGPAFTFSKVIFVQGDIQVPVHDWNFRNWYFWAGYLPLDSFDSFYKHSYINKVIDPGSNSNALKPESVKPWKVYHSYQYFCKVFIQTCKTRSQFTCIPQEIITLTTCHQDKLFYHLFLIGTLLHDEKPATRSCSYFSPALGQYELGVKGHDTCWTFFQFLVLPVHAWSRVTCCLVNVLMWQIVAL